MHHHLNIAPQMADHRLFLLLTALSVAALVILLAVLIRRSRSSSKHHRLARMATGGLVVLILAGFAPAVLHQSEENQQKMAAWRCRITRSVGGVQSSPTARDGK